MRGPRGGYRVLPLAVPPTDCSNTCSKHSSHLSHTLQHTHSNVTHTPTHTLQIHTHSNTHTPTSHTLQRHTHSNVIHTPTSHTLKHVSHTLQCLSHTCIAAIFVNAPLFVPYPFGVPFTHLVAYLFHTLSFLPLPHTFLLTSFTHLPSYLFHTPSFLSFSLSLVESESGGSMGAVCSGHGALDASYCTRCSILQAVH